MTGVAGAIARAVVAGAGGGGIGGGGGSEGSGTGSPIWPRTAGENDTGTASVGGVAAPSRPASGAARGRPRTAGGPDGAGADSAGRSAGRQDDSWALAPAAIQPSARPRLPINQPRMAGPSAPILYRPRAARDGRRLRKSAAAAARPKSRRTRPAPPTGGGRARVGTAGAVGTRPGGTTATTGTCGTTRRSFPSDSSRE